MPERHKKVEMKAPDRYYHARVPFLNSPVNVFSVIYASAYAIGLAGSYAKSEKLINYHKYLLYLDVTSTPFIVIELLWRASSMWSEISKRIGPGAPENFEQDMKLKLTFLPVLLCAYHGILYMKKIYAANVAARYQRFLLLSEGNKACI